MLCLRSGERLRSFLVRNLDDAIDPGDAELIYVRKFGEARTR